MKSFLITFLIFIISINISHAQWERMSIGNSYPDVYSLASGGNTIFAGAWWLYWEKYKYYIVYVLYKSSNNGTNWEECLGDYAYSLAVNGNNVFAGTGYYVYLSTNNGASWTHTYLNNGRVYSLAVNGNNVFAGTGSCDYGCWGIVFLSTNNGTSWTQTSYNWTNGPVLSLAVNGNNVFAGTDGNGVYVSTNNGTNWTQTSLNNQLVLSLAIKGNNVFAGTQDSGVYLSTNNGSTWTQTSLNNRTVPSLAVYGNNIFAGTSGYGVYVSTNNGISWIQWNEGLGNPNATVNALCISNNYIFAGTSDGNYNGGYRRLLELTGIKPVSGQLPAHFELSQNYPNPFNPTTKIKFALPKSSFAKLVMFDILGRELEILVNEQLNAGSYEVEWNASNYPSGVYYYKLNAGDFTETKKMILIK